MIFKKSRLIFSLLIWQMGVLNIQAMPIFVKLVGTKHVDKFMVESSDTLYYFKMQIEKKLRYSVDDQLLTYRERALEDSRTFSFYNISKGSTITLYYGRRRSVISKDLSGIDLSGIDLRGRDLSGINLRGRDLSEENFSGADLSGGNLSGANLSGANLSGANLLGANLLGANLSGANLSDADLSYAKLKKGALDGVRNLKSINLRGVDLRKQDLSGKNFFGANLSGVNLSGANFYMANLSYAKLSGANFYRADLSYTNLKDVNFSGANFDRAKLYRANLSGATISLSSIAIDEFYKEKEIYYIDQNNKKKRLSFKIKDKARERINKVREICNAHIFGQVLCQLIRKDIIDYGLNQYSFSDSDEENFLKDIQNNNLLINAIFRQLPKRCQKIVTKEENGNIEFARLDPSWKEIDEKAGSLRLSPAEKKNDLSFLLSLYQKCLAFENNKKALDYKSIRENRELFHYDGQNFTEMFFEESNLEESLNNYLKHIAPKPTTFPIKVNYIGQPGLDFGGLRRNFFCSMQKLVEEIISSPNPQELEKIEGESVMYRLGQMTARTFSIESKIPAFNINAPLALYDKVMEGTLTDWLVSKAYQSEENQSTAAAIYKLLTGPKKDYLETMGYNEENEDEIFKDLQGRTGIACDLSESQQSNQFKNFEDFANGFREILSRERIRKLGIRNREELKRLIEGVQFIGLKDFLSSIEIISQNKPMEDAYREAWTEIIDELLLEDGGLSFKAEKVQNFMRSFLAFITGIDSFTDGQKIKLEINSNPDSFPVAHTCSASADCPKLLDKEEIKKRFRKIVELMEEGSLGGFQII